MTVSYRGPSPACIGAADPGPTLRDAKTRDPKAWAYYLNRVIELFGEHSDVVFAQHHWPKWGNEAVVAFLETQRDAYKFLNDQTRAGASGDDG